MKIGVLTFHRSINTGAYIQCYSLIARLKMDFPNDEIEVIDYYTKRVINNYACNFLPYMFGALERTKYGVGNKSYLRKLGSRSKQLIMNPYLLMDRRREWELFRQDWNMLSLSTESLCSDSCDEFYQWIYGRYDIIIVGSDCVWQYLSYPFPNVYFLHDDIGGKKISYAGCAYGLNLDELAPEDYLYIQEAFSTYEYLGVRDKWTEDIINDLGVQVRYEHNCDPAFLLDLNRIPVDTDVLRKKLVRMGVDFDKRIIGLQTNCEMLGKYVRDIVRTEHYDAQIVAIRRRNRFADLYIDDLTPLEWCKVFGLFDLTVTDFFHGTILSIVNGTIPIAVDFECGMRNNRKTRLRDLIKRLDLSDQFCEIGSKVFDFERLNNQIRKVINDGRDYYHDGLKKRVEIEASSYNSFFQQMQNISQRV